jgi:hypothetical protein
MDEKKAQQAVVSALVALGQLLGALRAAGERRGRLEESEKMAIKDAERAIKFLEGCDL